MTREAARALAERIVEDIFGPATWMLTFRDDGSARSNLTRDGLRALIARHLEEADA